MLPQGGNMRLCLLAFSAAFFAAALFFSLRPGKILVWVGKVLNPCFLLFLGILVIVAMLRPGAAVGAVVPEGAYALSLSSPASSRATTPWTRWQALPSASWSCRSSVTSA